MLALSIRQPWAALLVSGRKTIEIRKWQTAVRGRVLIHASSIADQRAEAWAWIEPDVAALSHQYGGIIGEATLTDVIKYSDPATFAADVTEHKNYADWYQPPAMFGFVFEQAKVLPFRRYKGDVKFFDVPDPK